ncbi:hypothetical protein HYC85_021175 [Camellia sinensis]|uniref:Uncharacterized protein n=1 Tax=Camellia sinensis TaxID=4442 RepID=A0A7J7GKV3_CAMSI|nr:hypothetical protein HYC85_021175 [Camellia sinensis]
MVRPGQMGKKISSRAHEIVSYCTHIQSLFGSVQTRRVSSNDFVSLQIPLLVATKMTSIKRSSFFIPSPETYSKASLRAIDLPLPLAFLTLPVAFLPPPLPLPWELECCLIRALPDIVQDCCLLRYFLGMRKRGLKKQQQEQQQKK